MKLKKQLKIARRENTRLAEELASSIKIRGENNNNIRTLVLELRDTRVKLVKSNQELEATLQTLTALSKRIDFQE